jgi:hypothetical protein
LNYTKRISIKHLDAILEFIEYDGYCKLDKSEEKITREFNTVINFIVDRIISDNDCTENNKPYALYIALNMCKSLKTRNDYKESCNFLIDESILMVQGDDRIFASKIYPYLSDNNFTYFTRKPSVKNLEILIQILENPKSPVLTSSVLRLV